MDSVRHAQGISLFRRGHYDAALVEFLRAASAHPTDWSAWFWAGQCERFSQRFSSAYDYLVRARQLQPEEKSILLALGIVLQLMERFQESVATLAQAIELDEDFVEAWNSLGVTQRKMGELDKALHNYDAGTKALARHFVRTAINSSSAPIIPYEDVAGTRWIECASFGALFCIADSPHIQRAAFPTGESAMHEMRSGEQGGLLWVDSHDVWDRYRLFLPNYFHTFREYLRKGGVYHNLIGNQGAIHEQRGEAQLAQEYYREASAFGVPGQSTLRFGDSRRS
jgi:tetratricopeptide (TPR) repeat protein